MSRYTGHADGYGHPYHDEEALTSLEFEAEWNWPCAAAAQTAVEVDPMVRPDGKDASTYGLGLAVLWSITVLAGASIAGMYFA